MKRILFILLLIICVGCKKEDKKVNIEMNCNDTITNVEIKEGNTISCKLLNDDYNFKIMKITDDKIELEVDKYGLNDGAGITQKVKKFTIEKDNELRIHTETTDYQQIVTFKIK